MNQDNSVIERFKRVAKSNRINPQFDDGILPAEKVEILRSHLNAAFFGSAEKWMLPSWAIQTIWDRGKRQDIQDILPNEKYSNWIVIGGPGSQSYGISDHTGLVTILEECGSFDFWPRADDIQFPALQEYDGPRLNLVTVDDQMYEWSTTSGPLEFNRLLYHVIEDDNEYIFNEIVLRNLSLEPQEFTFYITLKPTSVRGMEPIESLTYDSSRRMLTSNDNLALIADKAPSMVIMDTFDNPNLLNALEDTGERLDQSYTSVRGNGTAVMKYTIHLRPAGHETLVFASPLFRTTEKDAPQKVNMNPRLRDDAVARWFDFNDDSPKGSYPDEALMMATAQGKTSLVIQARKFVQRMASDILVNRASDITRIHMALSRSGCNHIAHTLAIEISQRFASLDITKDDAGKLSPLVWAFKEMEKIYPETPLQEPVTSFINSMGSMIEQVLQDDIDRKAAIDQLAPEPVSEENQDEAGEFDHDSVDTPVGSEAPPESGDAIAEIPLPEELEPLPKPLPHPSLSDALEAVWTLAAAEIISPKRDDISTLLESYRDTVDKICRTVLSEHTWSFESESDMDTIMDIIGAFSLLKGKHVYKPLIESLTREVSDNCSFRGLLRYPKPSSRVSSHLRLRLTNSVMMMGDRDEVERTIEKLHDYLSEYHLLPQWVDINTKGGAYGDGCSILAAADLRLLLRDILVYERDGSLFVFPGLPDPWVTSTGSIMAEGIPTEIGNVSLKTGVSTNQHQIEIELEKLPEEIEVFLPSHIPLNMVKVFGGSIVERFEEPPKRIRLVPLSERITLTFHR